MLSGPSAIDDRLGALGAVLREGRALWHTAPFRDRRVPWEDELPDLSAWVRSLSDAALFALENDPYDAPDAPAVWRDLAARLAPLTHLDPLPSRPAPLAPDHAWHVKERKQDQIGGVVGVSLAHVADAPAVVEWCAGRGSLGRALAAALDRPGILLERDPELCRPPGGLSERGEVRHVQCDVLDAPDAHIPRGALVVGLHACGTLTDRLLDAAVARDAPVVAAPCCLHRLVDHDHHQPRSALGRALDPGLSRDDLRVATREARHAGARRTRRRRNEMLLRAGWDLLRRASTGEDRHHGLPVLPRAAFDLSFQAFMDAMRPHGDVGRFDEAAAVAAAARRVREIRALELPRLLFRRAIEVWVDLDRAAWLSSHAREVHVGTFCAFGATPRNIALVGVPRS